jgi:DNA-binding CsgD family transcriptional regulator
MLGSVYKRNGQLNKALELFQQSKEEALARKDELGVLNSLNSLIDLFLYWDIPEYANIYASEAVHVEKTMKEENPMVSAQTYINKGRALHELGRADSVLYYAEHARKLCQSLPYNSGMVDVDLLHGCVLTQKSGDSLLMGINKLQQVTQQGTTINRVRAYYQLAHTYLRNEQNDMAEVALDSMYMLLNQSDSPVYLHLDYEHILDYYLKTGNHDKVEKYVRLMLQEQRIFKEKSLNFNLVCSLVDLQTEKERHELKILQLHQKNQRLWILIGLAIFFGVISVIVVFLFRLKRYHIIQMRKADERFAMLAQELNQSNVEKEKITQEIREFLKDHDNRQELETLTPFILKEEGEVKFRQCFELLYPLFLPRLREKVPSITRREELLSMLIVLKQDNKEIAELLAIAPRSVLMLRHRFRQKIGMATEYSLENFIEDTLGVHESVEKASEANSE